METERMLEKRALLAQVAHAHAGEASAAEPPEILETPQELPPDFRRKPTANAAGSFDPDALTRALRIAGAALSFRRAGDRPGPAHERRG